MILNPKLRFTQMEILGSSGSQTSKQLRSKSGGALRTTSQREAQAILGKNMLGIKEASNYLQITPTDKELACLEPVPFSSSMLRAITNSHVLVPGFPLTLLEIRERAPPDTFYYHSGIWYTKEAFAKRECVELGWKLFLRDVVPYSTNKSWRDQVRLLDKNESVPRASELAYCTVLHFLARGERLFRNIYARCRDCDKHNEHVALGNFDSHGLNFYNYKTKDAPSGLLGLASSINCIRSP